MNDTNRFLESTVLKATGARRIESIDVIQTLWKGYGEIVRVELHGADRRSVIAKHVCFPKPGKKQRRRQGNDRSHARKVRSYRVEAGFYTDWSEACNEHCRVPACLAFETNGADEIMVLEDLDAAGFARRCPMPAWPEMAACLTWLAEFHAAFLGKSPAGLWNVGTYWHLDTRPDELRALNDAPLRAAAGAIDKKLRNTPQTIVHGDAKVENFCFSESGQDVAALDFQYVGAGCGMKDVAYLAMSCLNEDECEQLEEAILDRYFNALGTAIDRKGDAPVDAETLEHAWRPLYRVAWADFHRFYKGWSGARFHKNSYSERVADAVIAALGGDGSRGRRVRKRR